MLFLRGLPALVIVVALLLGLRVYHDAYYIASRRQDRFGTGWNRLTQPMAATSYAERGGLDGPVLNHLNFGGYLIWARSRPVFIDGRLEVMGEAFYEEYLKINAGTGWAAMMERYDPKVVLVPHTFLKLVTSLDRDSQWALVGMDGVGALFLRVSPEHGPLLAEARRRWGERRRKAGAEDGPLEARRNLPWLRALFGKRSFAWEAYGRGNALYGLGLYAEARAEYRMALRLSDRDYAPLTGNLAASCFRLGLRKESLAWYGRTLDLDPDYPRARERAESLRREIQSTPREEAP